MLKKRRFQLNSKKVKPITGAPVASLRINLFVMGPIKELPSSLKPLHGTSLMELPIYAGASTPKILQYAMEHIITRSTGELIAQFSKSMRGHYLTDLYLPLYLMPSTYHGVLGFWGRRTSCFPTSWPTGFPERFSSSWSFHVQDVDRFCECVEADEVVG